MDDIIDTELLYQARRPDDITYQSQRSVKTPPDNKGGFIYVNDFRV